MPTLIVAEVPVLSVRIGRGRSVDDEHVKQLMSSMSEVGLLEPIVIGKDNRLIAGYHRVKAAQRLAWDTIPAVTFDGNEVEAQIATIDENIVRRVMSVAERSTLLAERKKLYEALHPETINHVSGGKARQSKGLSASADSAIAGFVADTASKTGKAPRTIREEVAIGSKIAPDVMEAVKASPIANSKTVLMDLAELPEEEQRGIVITPEVQSADNAEKLKREISIARRKSNKGKPSKRKTSPERCAHAILRCEKCGKRLRREDL